jgi:hypothetical protein
MKFLKFIAMAMVITFCLTIAAFAENPAPQVKSSPVSFTKAEKVTVASVDVTVAETPAFSEKTTVNANSNLPVAKITSAGTNLIPNVSSLNRNVYLIDINTESPPDANILEINHAAIMLGSKVKQTLGFDKTEFIRRE